MTAGMHPTALADAWLDWLGNGTAGSPPANLYVKLHTGDPGAAGTANASANTTRQLVTFAASSGGTMAKDNSPSWINWTNGSETLTHLSLWTAASGGTFLLSIDVPDKSVINGDDVVLSSLIFNLAPLAA